MTRELSAKLTEGEILSPSTASGPPSSSEEGKIIIKIRGITMFEHTYHIYDSVVMAPVVAYWQKRACIVVPKIKMS